MPEYRQLTPLENKVHLAISNGWPHSVIVDTFTHGNVTAADVRAAIDYIEGLLAEIRGE